MFGFFAMAGWWPKATLKLSMSCLKKGLVELKKASWAILYRHKDTEELWDLVYQQGEVQGGGPRRLRRLDHNDPEKWDPYAN